MYKAMFEKFPHISELFNWPIKVIIVNIPKIIKYIIKFKRNIKPEHKVRVLGIVK